MPSEFSLFLLPMLVFNRVLKLVTPFELVAISLCSKKSKTLCSSARSQLQCKNSTKEFTLMFSLNKEIRLMFDYYPEVLWIFKIDYFPIINNIPPRKNVLQKFLSIFQRKRQGTLEPTYTRVMNELFLTSWIPTEDESISEYSLQFYTSNEDHILNMNLFISHLSDIFNVSLANLDLHFQNFTQEDNERIIDFYCMKREKRQGIQSLALTAQYGNTTEGDQVVDSLLRRQHANNTLKLNMEPTSEFKFKSEYFRNKIRIVDISLSHWVSFSEFLEIDAIGVILSNSSFTSNQFKLLVEKWSSGWIPKFKLAIIEFSETVGIVECVTELRTAGGIKNLNVYQEVQNINRYYLRRMDGRVAEITLEAEKTIHFHVFLNAESNRIHSPHLFR
ncbi:hypothetical protein CRE_10550 [Caenorhabditis remanei]|uniref:F-box domain-containing protein n=1 Tax=Caenorhabditis remanei TaxID=31234 RepID=E3N776_CAERE|nr:hypothetical protein CRE_10550 [Caenorhabditis remanei]